GTWRRIDFGDAGQAAIDSNAIDTRGVTMYHTYFNVQGSLIGYARVTSVAGAVDGGWSFFGCVNGASANGIGCNEPTEFYAPLVLGPGTPNPVYFGTDRLYRSSNKGANNIQVSLVLDPDARGFAISAIAISQQDDDV